MRWFLPFLVAFILIIPPASSLETGTVFSVSPGTGYKCVYVSLPQDLGVTSLESTAEAEITVNRDNSPWTDMTYSKVVMQPGIMSKSPVCFRYSEKEEGDFSFYSITLSSRELDVSSSINGGLCVSSYEDVDTGVDMDSDSDACSLLNTNADLIDLSFKEDVTPAIPGEIVTKTLYITSYANLEVKLSIATNLQNDFGEPVVTTSPSKPMASRKFKVKAPEREGEFDIIVNARAEGCSIQACNKQKKSVISVNGAGKQGFSASVIPKNINLKEAGEVILRVVISNYGETEEFLIEPKSSPSAEITPESKTLTVEKDGEGTAVFKLSAGEEDLYRVEFKVSTENSEKLLTSYVTVGELLKDAISYSSSVQEEYPDISGDVEDALDGFETSYSTNSYEEDVDDYEDFLDQIDEMKEKSNGNGGTSNGDNGTTGEAGFDFLLLAIPIIIVIAVVLILFAYKKSRSAGPGQYGGYTERGF